MKRNFVPTILAFSLVLTAAAPVAFAQVSGDPASQNQVQTGRHDHARDPHKVAMHMSKKLGLSADQTAKVEPILAERRQKVQALRADVSLSKEQKHVQMHAIAKNTNDQLAGVLTPAQMDQLKSMRKGHRHHKSEPTGV